MYFSVITSTNVGAGSVANPTARRTLLTFATAPVESPVPNFASARISWFSAHVTIGWRNVKTRRVVVLMADEAHGPGGAGQPAGRTVTLFWLAPTNCPCAFASKYAARRGSVRAFR